MNVTAPHPLLSNIIDISNGGCHQITPIRVFEDNEDIWFSNINKLKQKSARSILPRPSNEDDNSPPKKKINWKKVRNYFK